MRKVYYLPFIAAADIDYLLYFSMLDIAFYNTERKAYDTICYKSQKQLAETLKISQSKLSRILKKTVYNDYFTIDYDTKTIHLLNNFHSIDQEKRPFIKIDRAEFDFLREQEDNLLIRYYLYIKYYSGKTGSTDFTANQFLSAIGYNTASISNKQKLSEYNKILSNAGLLSIGEYRDELGHKRLVYKVNQ